MAATNNLRRVVITGIGPITALGVGVEKLWQSMECGASPTMLTQQATPQSKHSSYRVYSPTPDMLSCLTVSKAQRNRLKDWFGEDIDPDHIQLLQAINLALEDSNLHYDEEQNEISLFLVHENPGIERFFSKCLSQVFDMLNQKAENGNRRIMLDKSTFLINTYQEIVNDAYNLQPFMFLYAISRACNFHGYSLYINNACASGLFAIESSYRQIATGQSKVAVVAGIDWPSRYLYKNLWFDWEGLYSLKETIRPFTPERDGIVLGDAACALIFEDYEHARERNAPIYGEYLGGGFDLEGWKVTVPAGTPESYIRCVQRAMGNSGITASEIDLINPHGVSTGVGDAYEANGLLSIFGELLPSKVVVNLKPLLGHTLGVCGLIETALTLLMLKKQWIVSTSDANNGTSALLKSRPLLGRASLKYALKVSAGFAGYNGAAVFRAPNFINESR